MSTPTLAPPAPAASDLEREAVRRRFRYWQNRTLWATFIGYAFFYLIRKNYSWAMPLLESELHISKETLGKILTIHGLLYGVSKFASGPPADRVNSRLFMSIGLLACVGLNLAFGFSASVVAFGVIWALNGWFQGMGYPPIARLMTHWFPPKVLAFKMAIWNTSHSVGTVATAILCGWLAARFGWRSVFIIPAILTFAGAIVMIVMLRDTPESMGLPPVEGTESARAADEPLARTLWALVFKNRYIWYLSFGNFFVYVVRYGFYDWGPTYLSQVRHMKLTKAGWTIAAFELAGGLGMLAGGWISDKVFAGRSGRTCMFYMMGCAASLLAFWKIPDQSYTMTLGLLCLAGFFVYGPQALVGIAAANLATKRAAGTAGGLTGIFGYASTALSGWGVGWLVQYHGWDWGFLMFAVSAVLGIAMFALCWPAPAHGYGEERG